MSLEEWMIPSISAFHSTASNFFQIQYRKMLFDQEFSKEEFDLIGFINESLDTSESESAAALLYKLQALGDKISDDINYAISFPSSADFANALADIPLSLDGSFDVDPCFDDLAKLHSVKENMIKTKEALKEAENWSMFFDLTLRYISIFYS